MSRFLLVPMLALLGGVSPAAWAEGDAAKGKSVFGRCSACHSTTSQNKTGPNLIGIVGRPAGSVEGFRYSKAMGGNGTPWTEESLDTYLAAPAKMVPGTSMMVNLPNPQDRADVIAYLKTLTP